MRKNFVFILCAGVLLDSASAQSGYLPPNPISPPTVGAPAMIPMVPLSPVVGPEISPPTIQLSPDTGPESSNPSAPNASSATSSSGIKASETKPSAGNQSTVHQSTTVQSPTHTVTETTGVPLGASVPSSSPSRAPGNAGTKPTSDKKASNSPVSALSLLGLGGSNPLLEALNGSSDNADSVDALSGLFGGKTASGGSGSTGGATLQKILSVLQKEQNSKNPGGTVENAADEKSAGAQSPENVKTAGASATRVPAQNQAAGASSGAAILKFAVNGYSISSSVTTLVSSIIARDGSFLLTGDRSYPAAERWQTETFYLFCKKTGRDSYRLFADVSQGSTVNTKSFLYQLARKTPITGTLTGDLLVFRTTDPHWTLDLVIRIFSPSVNNLSGR